MSHGENEFPDPEKIKDILNIIADKAPPLLKELADVLYAPDQAKNFGIAVSTFYRQLKDAGMKDDEAFELTRQYMSSLNLGKTFSGFSGYEKRKED